MSNEQKYLDLLAEVYQDGEWRSDRTGTGVSSLFAHHYSKDLIQSELDKCELVCSNCHRIRTRNRKTGHGKNKQ